MIKYVINRIFLSSLIGFIMLIRIPFSVYAQSEVATNQDKNRILISTEVPPRVISGEGGIYKKDSSLGLDFMTNDVKENLQIILVDGKEISSENYTVSGDPLTITLNAKYLNTLAYGNHTVEIVTVNGTASANFTITDESQQKTQEYSSEQAKKPSEKQSKKMTEVKQVQNESRYSVSTGDKADIILSMIVMVVSLIGLIVVIMRIKKNKRRVY